jgi:hypothetical protein
MHSSVILGGAVLAGDPHRTTATMDTMDNEAPYPGDEGTVTR